VELLFATSFGEAVQNPDPHQYCIGALILLGVKFLAGKFPAFAWLWGLVEKLIPSPSPAPGPAPDGTPTPVPVPDKLSLSDLVKLFLELIAKRKQQDADEKAAIEAVKAELLK
jgi:hypothetical protein